LNTKIKYLPRNKVGKAPFCSSHLFSKEDKVPPIVFPWHCVATEVSITKPWSRLQFVVPSCMFPIIQSILRERKQRNFSAIFL